MALIQDLTPTQIAQAAGLQPAEIEALRPSIVVTMGRKPETWLRDHEALGWEKPTGRAPGFSWGTGRFWIGLRPAKTGQQAVTELAPDFAAFNAQGDGDARKIKGNLIGQTWAECFITTRRAQKLPGIPSPHRRPTCALVGIDDVRGPVANRWNGREFESYNCPGSQCRYSQKPDKGAPACRTVNTLRLQLAIPGCPGAYAELSPKGGHSKDGESWGGAAADQWHRWMNAVDEQWLAVGGHGDTPVFGLPISVRMVQKTGAGTEYSIPEIALDFKPGATIQAFFAFQMKNRDELRAAIGAPAERPRLTVRQAQAIEADLDDLTPPARGDAR